MLHLFSSHRVRRGGKSGSLVHLPLPCCKPIATNSRTAPITQEAALNPCTPSHSKLFGRDKRTDTPRLALEAAPHPYSPLRARLSDDWVPIAVKELRLVARRRAERLHAAAAVEPDSSCRGVLHRWRQQSSEALQAASAAIFCGHRRRGHRSRGRVSHVSAACVLRLEVCSFPSAYHLTRFRSMLRGLGRFLGGMGGWDDNRCTSPCCVFSPGSPDHVSHSEF